MRVNKVVRGLAAPTGLLLVLVATTAGADSARRRRRDCGGESGSVLSEVSASEVDALVSASSVVVFRAPAREQRGNEVGQNDDNGTFLGQLVRVFRQLQLSIGLAALPEPDVHI